MKYIDEFRDGTLARKLAADIRHRGAGAADGIVVRRTFPPRSAR